MRIISSSDFKNEKNRKYKGGSCGAAFYYLNLPTFHSGSPSDPVGLALVDWVMLSMGSKA